MNNNFIWYFLTCGPVGYLPYPGTCATVLSVPVWLSLLFFVGPAISFFVGSLLLCSAWYGLTFFKSAGDDRKIVIDEVIAIGLVVGFCSFSWGALIAGVLIFRFFDGTKMMGISLIETYAGSWAILADDLAAALYTIVLVKGCACLIC